MNAIAVRRYQSKFGTFSMFMLGVEANKFWWIAEPPWRNNIRSQSCIPVGRYEVIRHTSPRYGQVLKLIEVPNRTDILFHVGNYAGDEEMGLKSDTDGCLLPGLGLGWLSGQQAVLSSKQAFNEIMATTPASGFTLEIVDLLQNGSSSSSISG